MVCSKMIVRHRVRYRCRVTFHFVAQYEIHGFLDKVPLSRRGFSNQFGLNSILIIDKCHKWLHESSSQWLRETILKRAYRSDGADPVCRDTGFTCQTQNDCVLRRATRNPLIGKHMSAIKSKPRTFLQVAQPGQDTYPGNATLRTALRESAT